MTTRKLQGPLGGDYQTDGAGNAVLLNSYPLTQEDDVPLRLAEHEARVTAVEKRIASDSRGLSTPNPGGGRTVPVKVMASDPLTLTAGTNDAATTITNSRVMAITDPVFTRTCGLGNYSFVNVNTYYRSQYSLANPTKGGQQPTGIEFSTDADEIEIITVGQGTLNVVIDGEWTSPTFYSSGKSNGNRYLWKVNFGSSELRNVVLFGIIDISGIRVGPLYRVWPSSLPKSPRLAFISDSFGTATGVLLPNGLPCRLAFASGYRDVRMSTIGGTGYLAKNASGGNTHPTFRDRYVSDLADYNPDVVVIAGGFNDGGQFTQDAIRAEADTLFSTHIATYPGVPLIIVGPWAPGNSYNSSGSIIATRNTLRAAALALGSTVPWVFIDTLTSNWIASDGRSVTSSEPWVFGTGKTTATTGDGNADRLTGSDGIHPSDVGSEYYGQRIAAAIASAMPIGAS